METHSSNETIKDIKLFRVLTDVCKDVPKVANVQMAAAIVIKNEIISIGAATKKSHPMQARFGKCEQAIFLHAEISALVRALKIVKVLDLEKASLYVCRIKQIHNEHHHQRRVDGWGLAYPCSGCMAAITEFGIKRILYTIDSPQLNWRTVSC